MSEADLTKHERISGIMRLFFCSKTLMLINLVSVGYPSMDDVAFSTLAYLATMYWVGHVCVLTTLGEYVSEIKDY